MLTHYLERRLHIGPDFDKKETSAIWSRNPSRRVIVFIHGYGGNAISSWADFHKLLPQEPNFLYDDFIFYGYDGLYTGIQASADFLCVFLTRLFTQPLSIINPSLSVISARPDNFRYKSIILAAHSLGAVICRAALLSGHEIKNHCHKDKDHWMDKTSMVLYAPADGGADVVELARQVGGPITRCLVAIACFKSPLIAELAKGSKKLSDLLTDTMAILNTEAAPYLIARQVIFPQWEHIVTPFQFGKDPKYITIAGATHTSVCKPNLEFQDPIDALRVIL